MSASKPLRLAALLFLLAGCGSGGPSGPENVDVGGVWNYTAVMDDGCTYDLRLSLSHAGPTAFGGSYTGTVTCETIGFPLDLEGRVTGGTVDGRRVTFNLGGPSFHNTGTMRGGRMTGTARERFSEAGLEFEADGTWTAAR